MKGLTTRSTAKATADSMSGARTRSQETEPFPAINDASIELVPSTRADVSSNTSGPNRPAASSSLSDRIRRVSQGFETSDLPKGFFAATGEIASSVFSRQTIARPPPDSLRSDKPAAENSNAVATASAPSVQAIPEERATEGKNSARSVSQSTTRPLGEPVSAAAFDNGYHFPPKHSFGESAKLGAVAFWDYLLTPVGFAVTLYGLNVVAWGGMLFLLLCNACESMDEHLRKFIEHLN